MIRSAGRTALGIVLALLAGAVPAAARIDVRPLGDIAPIPIGKSGTEYYEIGAAPLRVPLQGPGKLSGYVRKPLQGPEAAAAPGTLIVAGLPGGAVELAFEFVVSKSSVWNDDRPGVPSGGRKYDLDVPAGVHELVLSADGPLLIALRWEGPPQPDVPGLRLPVTAARPQGIGTTKESPWDVRGSAGLGIIYNDNILTASIDDIDDFESGIFPYKFAHESTDDLVVAPSLQIEARRDFVSWGQSRFRFRVKRWIYTHNPIKTNTDLDFYIRQYFGRNQSLELYLHAAPEQYIRQLTDRSPLVDPDRSLVHEEFSFQRNIWNLAWRQKLRGNLDGRLIYERNYRYYNQPFMENDIEAWELRATLFWKLSKTYSAVLGYSYEDGNGRGVDQVGETIATSDNSDPSYERDLYRAELQARWPALKPVVDRIDVTFLYMDYYYTADKPLVEDPFHVGRRDEYTKVSLEFQRRVARPLTVKLATRRTERITKSPWEGDLTTDKAFVQWLFWVDLTYRF